MESSQHSRPSHISGRERTELIRIPQLKALTQLFKAEIRVT
jgi:hypothetical protein